MEFLTFLGLSAVVIATPGPDTALTLRNTLRGGRRAGVVTAAGVCVGQVVWAIATSVGLVAVLLASEPIFQTLKLLGAGYLVFLGAQSLRAALKTRRSGVTEPRTSEHVASAAAFREGLINNLANPNMAIFFPSLLPQFAPAGAGMLSALLALGLVFACLTMLWLGLYAVVAARVGRLVRATRMGRAVDAVAGIVLVGLGVRVALSER